jgi:hypothetical protein
MLARVMAAAVNGIEAFPVEVDLNCGWGDTLIVIVGRWTWRWMGCAQPSHRSHFEGNLNFCRCAFRE